MLSNCTFSFHHTSLVYGISTISYFNTYLFPPHQISTLLYSKITPVFKFSLFYFSSSMLCLRFRIFCIYRIQTISWTHNKLSTNQYLSFSTDCLWNYFICVGICTDSVLLLPILETIYFQLECDFRLLIHIP